VTVEQRRLEAPHRRLQPGSRLIELVAVRTYRTASWILGRIPPGIARAVVAGGAVLSYALWPTKRRWSNANFGHVLGLPPSDRRVRRMALRAYGEYARYIVELMRLPRMDRAEAVRLVDQDFLETFEPVRAEQTAGLILALGHVGNNDAVAAAVASRGYPISVVADDSAFPELYEDLRRLRESWGIHLIPWRNLREMFGVLRRGEYLGLLTDWGYRPDGIPVRLFDAWTTLPAGPATLAARTGARILPVTIRRDAGDRFHVSWADPISVSSSSPADLARATQQLAEALEATIAAAPHQWYSFKPIWPATPEESAGLERRAAAMLADERPAPPATRARVGSADRPVLRGGDGAPARAPAT
jgi:KDO2-lipid IV(A) lauroyltransferase